MLRSIVYLILASEVASDNLLTPTTGWSLLAWSQASPPDSTTSQQVVVVDLFDTNVDLISTYRSKGHIVICYFSAGTAESYRADVKANLSQWQALGVGGMAQWSDETWLDITKLDALQRLMTPRLDLAAKKGCSGVEPDNTDCFKNTDECAIPGTDAEKELAQLNYYRWLADYAHGKGLLIALKNSIALISDVVKTSADFAIVEQCLQYNECDSYSAFFASNKPIFGIEYHALSASDCSKAVASHVQMKHCAGTESAGICSNQPLKNCYSNPTWNNATASATTQQTQSTGASSTASTTSQQPQSTGLSSGTSTSSSQAQTSNIPSNVGSTSKQGLSSGSSIPAYTVVVAFAAARVIV